jgi:hypothetical protein
MTDVSDVADLIAHGYDPTVCDTLHTRWRWLRASSYWLREARELVCALQRRLIVRNTGRQRAEIDGCWRLSTYRLQSQAPRVQPIARLRLRALL